jgi:hypothetical protein
MTILKSDSLAAKTITIGNGLIAADALLDLMSVLEMRSLPSRSVVVRILKRLHREAAIT